MANTYYADSSEARVALIAEADWGTTPTTPVFKTMRVTGESLSLETETAVSSEIRADRNVADLIRMSEGTGGGVDMELVHDDVTDLLFEGAMQSAYSGNKLINASTQKSFTIERTFGSTSSGTATNTFIRHTGMMVDTMAISLSAGSMVTASYGFVGKKATTGDAVLGDAAANPSTAATYTAASSESLMSASTDFASLTMAGITPVVSSLTLNTTNNLRRQAAVGSDSSVGIGNGRFEVSGSIDFYLENKVILDEYLSGDNTTSLAFTIGKDANKKFTFNIPVVKLESVSVNAGGNDSDVFVSVGWRGLFSDDVDGGTGGNQGGTMMITKAVT
jgi:hypothetical protein